MKDKLKLKHVVPPFAMEFLSLVLTHFRGGPSELIYLEDDFKEKVIRSTQNSKDAHTLHFYEFTDKTKLTLWYTQELELVKSNIWT